MAVVGDSGLPHGSGRRDALHHRDRVRKKITEQLKQRVGEEDIIAAGPEKRVNAGRSPIAEVGRTPPAFVIMRTGTRIPAACSACSSA